MTEPDGEVEIQEGYADPETFPDYDEVDSTTVLEDESGYDPTAVDIESDTDEEQE